MIEIPYGIVPILFEEEILSTEPRSISGPRSYNQNLLFLMDIIRTNSAKGMNNVSFRLKNNKKAVTPVIATIILIAATLVLALVVGAYTFGLFGSNVKGITVSSATLNSGAIPTTLGAGSTATLYLLINNPGGATNITSVSITSGGVSVGTLSLGAVVSGTCTVIASVATQAPAGVSSPVTLCFSATPAATLNSGQTYSIVVGFKNNQQYSTALIAS